MAYYYCSGLVLSVGDVIQPGNWVKTALGYGRQHNQYYRELLLEHVRRSAGVDAPSRAASVLAFRDRNSAESPWRQGPNHVYEVTPVESNAGVVERDMHWIDLMDAPNTLDSAIDLARRYWGGDMTGAPVVDVLIPGPARVTPRLHRFAGEAF